MINLVKERELFEAWHFNKYYTKDADKDFLYEIFESELDDNIKYISYEVDHSWQAWLASSQREGFKFVPVEPEEKQWSGLARHLCRYMQMHDRYCPKTLKKYFDRFIGKPPEWLDKEVGNWESDHAFATADLGVFIYKAMIRACDE
jgi:hypothetical protein